MNISGIMKLRLVITILFIMMIVAIGISFAVASEEIEIEEEFLNSLTDDEINQLVDIYSNYPEYDNTVLYTLSGWLMYIVTGALFFLTIRIWKTNNIY